MSSLIDTHCHIHSSDYGLDREEVYESALKAGVSSMVCVGTSASDSQLAVDFAASHSGVFASVGLHPHDAKQLNEQFEDIKALAYNHKVVAVGECGLDFYYDRSPRQTQVSSLERHIELAQEMDLPLIFHIRQAFRPFWPIFDSCHGLRGVVHSFSATQRELDRVLDRGLLVGVNGIATFTKDDLQLAAIRDIPLGKLILETDSPLLTPVPFRGRINEPKNIVEVVRFLAEIRSENRDQLASATTHNAKELFGI